ncbi:hypothetical protein HDU77_009901 [Chytriomyces hyalinus]|nr:hypothetical protein HDU77_009901 [Chytriomyces hyalinus]
MHPLLRSPTHKLPFSVEPLSLDKEALSLADLRVAFDALCSAPPKQQYPAAVAPRLQPLTTPALAPATPPSSPEPILVHKYIQNGVLVSVRTPNLALHPPATYALDHIRGHEASFKQSKHGASRKMVSKTTTVDCNFHPYAVRVVLPTTHGTVRRTRSI